MNPPPADSAAGGGSLYFPGREPLTVTTATVITDDIVSSETFTILSTDGAYLIRFHVADEEPWNWTVTILRANDNEIVARVSVSDSMMHWLAQWVNGHQG